MQECEEAILLAGALINGALIVDIFIDAGAHGGSSAGWRVN